MDIWLIFVAAIVAALYELVAHWFPWSMLLRAIGSRNSQLHSIHRYIIGVLGFMVPIAGVLIIWEQWPVLWMMITVVAFSGAAVILAYLIDHVIGSATKLVEMEERYAAEEEQGRSACTRDNHQA